MGIPDHLTCLLRNLYAGQEATVRTGHGTIFSLEFLVVCSYKFTWASQVVLVAKNLPTQCRRHKSYMGLISGLGRSSGGGHDNPLQ